MLTAQKTIPREIRKLLGNYFMKNEGPKASWKFT